ncbi:MAG: hypothetical protein HY700_14790 [Gemmatimonadetes bacterium]|nr:hypothetical protein [Gemmatimonadota bacterium]
MRVFLTEDPIGIAGGANLYQYAGNNPATYTDPFGLCPEWLTGRPCIGGGFIRGPVRPMMFAGAAARGATGDLASRGVVGVSGTPMGCVFPNSLAVRTFLFSCGPSTKPSGACSCRTGYRVARWP